ncbi:MAG TPA: GNAT family N-acetyltransferase [Phycisphaerae bacterium]|nr:GNAT family N-acetyltransferase [Phycisphaerae bacterium]HRY68808.1 GNAT family N-acetyltransferase [Phycisphaerae bacterium]HSA27472.1 GNAT family N-acetyltransferase [Phycisphaerae bacterium]
MEISRPTTTAELHEALGMLLEREGLSAGDVRDHIQTLIRYTRRRGLSLNQCMIAREGGRLLTSCLFIDAPGRMSTVFIPNRARFLKPPETVTQLLRQTTPMARDRGVRVVQGLVAPAAAMERSIFEQAGYTFLAELIYLESDLAKPVLTDKHPPILEWETYEPGKRQRFGQILQGTYVESRDCAKLTGVRPIDEILDSHLAAGEFDPDHWRIGVLDGEPAGILLLAYLAERATFEVVYMGVLPACRSRGVGTGLLTKAVELGRERGVMTLTLTVDAVNAPARKLYTAFGFRETSRREVWIQIL